jgi:hypothetical protein
VARPRGRGVAGGDIKEVGCLTDVDEDGDALAIGVAEAAGAARAEVEDVAVDEGDVGLAADVRGVPRDAGVVEAKQAIALTPARPSTSTRADGSTGMLTITPQGGRYHPR